LTAEGGAFTSVDAADVARYLPGLRPSGVDAVWQADAGPVRADHALAVQLATFRAGGGDLRVGARVVDVVVTADAVGIATDHAGTLVGDVVVLAPGPGAVELLPRLGIDLAMAPVLEQVTYLAGRRGWEDLPCWYEGEHDGQPSLYAMPTPGFGYKVGIDRPLRDLRPDPSVEISIVQRVAADLSQAGSLVEAVALSSQVCSWTDSPDGRFVLDRILDDRVVLACGDSGEGFKFSALMGEILADLAEGTAPDADVASFGLSRFQTGGPIGGAARPALGR
jgi:glycine/D-amino acid oxidase-like deaminating enzyme